MNDISIQDVRDGMCALLDCSSSELDKLDNREYDKHYQKTLRVLNKAHELFSAQVAVLTAQRDELAKQNHLLREALDFYASKFRYGSTWSTEDTSHVMQDKGKTAQQALATPDTSGLLVCDAEPVGVVKVAFGKAELQTYPKTHEMPNNTELYAKKA